MTEVQIAERKLAELMAEHRDQVEKIQDIAEQGGQTLEEERVLAMLAERVEKAQFELRKAMAAANPVDRNKESEAIRIDE